MGRPDRGRQGPAHTVRARCGLAVPDRHPPRGRQGGHQAAEYLPPHEDTTADRPLQLTTGRTVYHFHTRTKTARVPELNAAAPEAWAEISPAEASAQGLDDGPGRAVNEATVTDWEPVSEQPPPQLLARV
ncbi:molybdopterin dinucleotide binding domain-containing protein [Streptomyces luteogriseus]|uniref:molybdopterin dinucleotide binding domain-containing protein n=1 Tax=Streptomyces luteogriseus TaxID=68233 RepID=UPI003F4D5582